MQTERIRDEEIDIRHYPCPTPREKYRIYIIHDELYPSVFAPITSLTVIEKIVHQITHSLTAIL